MIRADRAAWRRLAGAAVLLGCSAGANAGFAFEAATPAPDLKAAAAAEPASTAAYGARCVGPAFDDTAAFQAAIDTGRTVYAPAMGGHCHVTRALAMKTPGQILHGDGRARTKIEVQPDFAGEGVFVAKTGEPGPVWRDLSVSFAQPDTDDRAKLTHYPPAFSVRNTPRFEMEHVGCYLATVCVDMKGNSGGATIADLQFDAFEVGIDIDGSLDTVRVTDPHWYPFGMGKRQQALFFDQGKARAIGLRIGRMDDLVLRGGIFLGGIGILVLPSPGASLSGSISDTDFDSGSGLEMRSGTLQIHGSEFVLGFPKAQGIRQFGGVIVVSACFFAGGPQNDRLVELVGGSTSIASSQFNTSDADITALAQTADPSALVVSASQFLRAANKTYTKPTIDLAAGRSILTSNYASDKGTGSGVFVRIGNDNPGNHVMGNMSPGWLFRLPLAPKGLYLFN